MKSFLLILLVTNPLFLDMGVIYYRKDLINQFEDGAELEDKIKKSLTWNQFIELEKRFENSPNPFYIFPGGNFEGMLCNYHEMLSLDAVNKIFYNQPYNLLTDQSQRALYKIMIKNIIKKSYKYLNYGE